MAMQPIQIGTRRQFLVETTAKPDSLDFLQGAEDTTGGCSVCRATLAEYGAKAKVLHATIEADARIPEGLTVTVVVKSRDGSLFRHVPDVEAQAAFFRTRTADWQLPAETPEPESVTLENTYREDGVVCSGVTGVKIVP
ncbi:MAG: hypothetical protein QM820_49330 [Minicystis sp.]